MVGDGEGSWVVYRYVRKEVVVRRVNVGWDEGNGNRYEIVILEDLVV